MKQIQTTLAAALITLAGVATPTLAQDSTEQHSDNPALSEGTELLNRGFQLLLEGLANEIEPMAEKWSEGWAELVDRFDELNAYHPPETLPNGDIIIRRRIPLTPEDQPLGETEL